MSAFLRVAFFFVAFLRVAFFFVAFLRVAFFFVAFLRVAFFFVAFLRVAFFFVAFFCRLLLRLLTRRLLLCRHSVSPLLGLGYHWTDLRAQPYLYRYTVYERAFSLLINKTDESEESSKRARHIQG